MLSANGVVAAPSAEQVVHDQANVLLERIAKVAPSARQPGELEDLVAEVIAPHVDFALFSRLVLGKYWRQISAQEQKQLEKGLTHLVVKTYSTALASSSELQISYLNVRQESRPDRIVVPTIVSSSGNPPVRVSYKLYKKNAVWKVYDVVIEGVSMALNYRSVLAERIRQEGVASVIDNLTRDPGTLAVNQ